MNITDKFHQIVAKNKAIFDRNDLLKLLTSDSYRWIILEAKNYKKKNPNQNNQNPNTVVPRYIAVQFSQARCFADFLGGAILQGFFFLTAHCVLRPDWL